MSNFRRFGGRQFSAVHNYTRSQISSASQSSTTQATGQANTREVFSSHIDLNGNSLLHTQTIYFQDGTSMSTASTSGAQGAQGAQGSPGSGSQGAQGAQGNPGTGTQGSQGAQGSPGIGTQGAQGATGAQGAQGAQGAGGDSFWDYVSGSVTQIVNLNSSQVSVVSQLNVTNGQPAISPGELQAMQMGYTNTGTPSADYGWIIATYPGSSYNNLCLNANQGGGTGAFLGVNTNAPQHTLDVNGDANIASNLTVGGSITTSSDYRIKTHILPMQQTSHSIAPLRPVQYTMRQTNTTHFGFLAHELQDALPFLVRGEKDGRGIQTVDTMSLVALLVHEVQQLQQRVDLLETQQANNRV